jgi:hypothetical protein
MGVEGIDADGYGEIIFLYWASTQIYSRDKKLFRFIIRFGGFLWMAADFWFGFRLQIIRQ